MVCLQPRAVSRMHLHILRPRGVGIAGRTKAVKDLQVFRAMRIGFRSGTGEDVIKKHAIERKRPAIALVV